MGLDVELDSFSHHCIGIASFNAPKSLRAGAFRHFKFPSVASSHGANEEADTYERESAKWNTDPCAPSESRGNAEQRRTSLRSIDLGITEAE
jgi:hypothetical protein